MDVLFISGIANNNQVSAVLDNKGNFQYLLNGSSSVAPHMENTGAFNSHRFILGGSGGNQRYGFQFHPAVIFNEISDPDTHSQSLSRCIDFCNQQNVSVINRPEAIQQTRRDLVTQALDNIDGVETPKTIRFSPKTPEDVRQQIADNFSGPVLLREAGTHGGKSLIKIDCPDDIEKHLYPLPLDGRPYYLIEFKNFTSQDGLYRKFRIVVIEGVPYLRHMLIHNHWMVHRTARTFMSSRKALLQEEKQWIETFYKKPPSALVNKIESIADRLKLDYFGIDCNLDDDDNLLIFEANANMNILMNTQPSPNLWDAPIAAIHEHLKAVIQSREKHK